VLRLRQFLASQKQLWEQQREIEALRKENRTLRSQNESMRSGMRRCVTCDYRLDFKQRQGSAPVLDQAREPPGDNLNHSDN